MAGKPIYTGKLVNLELESVELPNGQRCEMEIVRHPGGAAVVAVDETEQVCLLRQYRHAAGGWIWELPAGKLEPDEAPLLTAQRELAEESGQAARCWLELGSIISSPGFCDEVIYLYMATELSAAPAQSEPDEVIEVHWLRFSDALAWVHEGVITDAKTVAGLCRAQQYLGPLQGPRPA